MGCVKTSPRCGEEGGPLSEYSVTKRRSNDRPRVRCPDKTIAGDFDAVGVAIVRVRNPGKVTSGHESAGPTLWGVALYQDLHSAGGVPSVERIHPASEYPPAATHHMAWRGSIVKQSDQHLKDDLGLGVAPHGPQHSPK